MVAPRVHSLAVVDASAALGEDVEIGPGAIIGPDVVLEDRVRVGAHAVLSGHTRIGEDVRIWPGAVLGEEPQDRHYTGERSYTEIGARTQVREYVTVHRGSQAESITVVGPDCLLMGLCHVGHNCRLEEGVTLGNGALLAGHVEVGARAFISGNAVVHQFVRIGRQAMIGGGSRVPRDLLPYCMLKGDAELQGLNLVGLRRSGTERQAMRELRRIYAILTSGEAPFPRRVEQARECATTEHALEVIRFLSGVSKRGYQLEAAAAPSAVQAAGSDDQRLSMMSRSN